MRLTVRLEPAEEGGYVVHCVEIPGAISEGETREEALENIVDAIQLVLDVRREEAERMVHRQRDLLATVDVDG